MQISDLLKLVLLASIWGGSFVLNRQVAPVLGPIWTVAARTWIAGTLLLLYFKAIGLPIEWKSRWKTYFWVGIVNTALPFVFYTYAAMHLPASLSVILNSSTPLFGAVLSVIVLKERMTFFRALGLMSGVFGVVLLKDVPGVDLNVQVTLSIFACLGAALCYAVAGIFIRQHAKEINPMIFAGASQITAGVSLLPFLHMSPVLGEVTIPIFTMLLVLAVVCSGIAYILYFKLLANVGPTRTLTVAYLMPAFGMFWGHFILGEVITFKMIIGCVFILLGVILVALRMPAKKSA